MADEWDDNVSIPAARQGDCPPSNRNSVSNSLKFAQYDGENVNASVANGGVQSNGGADYGDDYGDQANGNDRDYGPRDVAGFLDNDEGAPPPEKPKEVYVPEDLPDEQLFDLQINSGINFGQYAAIPVNVSNTNNQNSFRQRFPLRPSQTRSIRFQQNCLFAFGRSLAQISHQQSIHSLRPA